MMEKIAIALSSTKRNHQNYLILEEQFIADGNNKSFELMNRPVEINHPLVRLVYGIAYYNGEELKPEDGVWMTEEKLEFKKAPPMSVVPIVVQYAVRKGQIFTPIKAD